MIMSSDMGVFVYSMIWGGVVFGLFIYCCEIGYRKTRRFLQDEGRTNEYGYDWNEEDDMYVACGQMMKRDNLEDIYHG
jgi:hypothetical protein